MARYEEERYSGQRGSARRGGYGERGREDDDFEQQERDRYRSSEYGREYGEGERNRGMNEGSWRGRERDYGRSLGGRDYEGYDEEDYGSSYSAGGQGQGTRYGSQYGQSERQQGRIGGQRYTQGMRDYNPSQGFGWSPVSGQGSQGYSSYGNYGPQSYGQTSQGYGRGYDEGTQRSQGAWRGQSTQGGQRYYQAGRGGSYGGMQADGWSGEPEEMRWGRQQGLYGSSEYGGYISSQRSQTDYQSHVGKGPKNWQRSDDRIREEVNEALARHPEIDASEIEVRVERGEVTLTGTVDERRAKRLAEDIVEDVFGVKDVENKIKVKGGFFGFGKDKDVTAKADKDTETTETTSRRQTAGTTGATTGTTR